MSVCGLQKPFRIDSGARLIHFGNMSGVYITFVDRVVELA